ncbi:hypothetical protein H310_00186 [Aphanomyces invadans]|uniref:Homeobox domain-containing protein n=1 Tax=Aphanomyces invadans TaxID=157072 RepID=A0A024UT25_9STRA|nr:hypothetical protein H310_00186 [Aphanomyces invadans]ETW09671.1 hypothetical protein H310_00186 [Aphanomyces invadans]RHY33597.1 hypothetical protein DYB32_001524 [Aphanomyces invadans]|eukprot:XP_008861082.1 hypothetical protein H310_00186 [Aphanomyces invadans]
MDSTTSKTSSFISPSRLVPATTNSLTLDLPKVHPHTTTRPGSPKMEFATPPTRTVTPPPIMKLPHSFASKHVSHPPHLQLKVSDPYITMDKKLATLKIPSACETPLHFTPPPPFPETSPSENKMMDADFAKRKKGTRRGTLNPEAKSVLKAWMFSPEHFAHPYPSEEEKEELAAEAGIEVKQLSNWFTNARKRLWQPVLRQSGVEVKNFLSTGRGGPRGAKLDVPTNISFLAGSNSPPSSPRSAGSNDDDDNVKSAFRIASVPDKVVKRMRRTEPQDNESGNNSPASSEDSFEHHNKEGFRDVEILAAKSLLGLHREYQSVH